MNTFDGLNPLSRRALRIPYQSPLFCVPSAPSSGSGSTAVSVLDIQPTTQLAGPMLSASVAVDGSVHLSWSSSVPNAYAYIIYRATNPAGPFTVQASGVIDRSFVDNPVSGTYLYKVTAIEPDFGETTASNVVTVTVP